MGTHDLYQFGQVKVASHFRGCAAVRDQDPAAADPLGDA
jgi:hypothetical protein